MITVSVPLEGKRIIDNTFKESLNSLSNDLLIQQAHEYRKEIISRHLEFEADSYCSGH